MTHIVKVARRFDPLLTLPAYYFPRCSERVAFNRVLRLINAVGFTYIG